MTGFRFASPAWLFLLIPLVLFIVRRLTRRQKFAVQYSSAALLRGLPVTMAQRVKRVLPWLRDLGLVLLIFALARPQYGEEDYRVTTEGIAIEMCIDRSGSMEAEDYLIGGQKANRLEAVKHVFREFVAGGPTTKGRPDDQIGLIAFGGFADSLVPLTLDHETLLKTLSQVELPKEIVDQFGRVLNEQLYNAERATAIGDALALAVGRLHDVQAKSKVIILLSDGESNAGVISPEEAAKAAKAAGIKVYTIGMGSDSPVAMRDIFGRQIQSDSHVDEATLKMIAKTTGGEFFKAKTTGSLEQVYSEIDKLEKTTTEGKVYMQYRELFDSLLIPGLVLILLETILVTTRFRSLP